MKFYGNHSFKGKVNIKECEINKLDIKEELYIPDQISSNKQTNKFSLFSDKKNIYIKKDNNTSNLITSSSEEIIKTYIYEDLLKMILNFREYSLNIFNNNNIQYLYDHILNENIFLNNDQFLFIFKYDLTNDSIYIKNLEFYIDFFEDIDSYYNDLINLFKEEIYIQFDINFIDNSNNEIIELFNDFLFNYKIEIDFLENKKVIKISNKENYNYIVPNNDFLNKINLTKEDFYDENLQNYEKEIIIDKNSDKINHLSINKFNILNYKEIKFILLNLNTYDEIKNYFRNNILKNSIIF